jgi:hypothetical protein
MLVKALKTCAGAVNFAPGQVLEVPDDMVESLINAQAVIVLAAETSVVEPVEADEPQQESDAEAKPKRRKR